MQPAEPAGLLREHHTVQRFPYREQCRFGVRPAIIFLADMSYHQVPKIVMVDLSQQGCCLVIVQVPPIAAHSTLQMWRVLSRLQHVEIVIEFQ